MKERNRLAEAIDRQHTLEQALSDNVELAELAEEEGDEETHREAEDALAKLKQQLAKLQLESLLSGEADPNDCFLEIHAGAGGTESQDWAEMLLRMYVRWAEKRGFKLEFVEESAGEEAGLKSVTVKVLGHNAYGWMKTESGVHRLVRISPFDSQARRHTSFASVWIYPMIDDSDRGRDRGKGSAHRHLPRIRCRWPAHQQDRQRHPYHPSAIRHRRPVPERPLAAQEPRPGLRYAARAAL